jgi:hypothetical protein
MRPRETRVTTREFPAADRGPPPDLPDLTDPPPREFTAAEEMDVIDLTADSDDDDAGGEPVEPSADSAGVSGASRLAMIAGGASESTGRSRPDVPPGLACAVCLDAVPNVKLSGCNHVCVCVACVPSVRPKRCPLCRCQFSDFTELFIG